jgi:hypothetical protein
VPSYGPHKIARAFHHALATTTPISNPTATAETHLLSPTQPFDIQPRPTSEIATSPNGQQAPAKPQDVVDRRTSIDTAVIRPTDGGMRVLLVEDNEINMKLLVAYMRKLKLNHTTAINGLEALNAYKEAQGAFDVIFMGTYLTPSYFWFPLSSSSSLLKSMEKQPNQRFGDFL